MTPPTIPPDTIGLTLPADMPFDDWMTLGKALFDCRRNADWMLADWWKHGRDRFRGDPQFELMLERAAVDPKRLSAMSKVADAFPAHMRAASLSFDVHREISTVAPDDRLGMIHRADIERWTERTAHARVVEYRYEQGVLWEATGEECAESLAVELWRMWNRLPTPAAREYAYQMMEIAAAAGFTCIDQEKAGA